MPSYKVKLIVKAEDTICAFDKTEAKKHFVYNMQHNIDVENFFLFIL